MSFFSLLAALALEQFHTLGQRNRLWLAYVRFANSLERSLNAGEIKHGVMAWLVATVPLCALLWVAYHQLYQINPLLGFALNVVVLYLTMGFRQFSASFSGISLALQEGDLLEARRLLAQWTNQPTSEMEVSEIARVAIEQGLIDSHKHVFGMIFWFALLPGPIGAVLYRMATILNQKWGMRDVQFGDQFGIFAARIHEWIDYVPIRLTSVSFAVVGNFEDAVYCWRSQAEQWSNRAYGILLASGAGAIGIKLGAALHQDHTVKYRPELGLGDEADAGYLRSAVGMIWRTVVLWLLMILMLTLTLWLARGGL